MALRPEDAPASLYGDDGEPRFFQDPAMDRVMTVLLNLTSELWIQVERTEALNALLLAKGIAVDTDFTAIAQQDDAKREAQLQDFVTRILAPLREAGA